MPSFRWFEDEVLLQGNSIYLPIMIASIYNYFIPISLQLFNFTCEILEKFNLEISRYLHYTTIMQKHLRKYKLYFRISTAPRKKKCVEMFGTFFSKLIAFEDCNTELTTKFWSKIAKNEFYDEKLWKLDYGAVKTNQLYKPTVSISWTSLCRSTPRSLALWGDFLGM